MINLYYKIEAADGDDDEKWLKLLIEADHYIFLCDNVEFRLGRNLFNKNLWKLYIEYLQEKNPKDMLIVYSKYCRFFLDDKEMKEAYEREWKKYGPVKLWWENLFDFEKCFDSNEMENENDERIFENIKKLNDDLKNCDTKEKILPFDKSICAKFYTTFQLQNFSLRLNYIRYILENANHLILRKLFKSCKYFFDRKQTPICYKFEASRKYQTPNVENLTLGFDDDKSMQLKNIYITGVFKVQYFERNFVSEIIPHLYKCDAKYVSVHDQNFSFNELKFLVENGNVVTLSLDRCKIKDENDDFIEVEEITAYLPNIEKLELSNIKVNANTSQALANQKFNGKIRHFRLENIMGEPFDADEFLDYIVENRDDRLYFDCYFNKNFDATFVKKFQELSSQRPFHRGTVRFSILI
uniref:Uncharacterized protein n=1 Tax=Panagrolaimus sp. ES5 TaxID=591445 RepID=A0AC34FBT1_9BILA